MTSIRTKFLITATVFAVALTGFAFLSSRFSARRGTRDLTASQAELALQFDLAIRKYIGDKVRPLMEQRVAKDEFIPEAMSTSFAARHVFDEVCREFPDYLLRFPSDNPRNPANAAGLEEMKLIQHFRENPNETKWSGFLTMNGREYLVHCIPRRMREGCLHCHGRPEDAPTSLLTRYGSKAGFHRSVGEVAAVDLVGIPMDKVNARAACEARTELTVLSVGVVLLAGAFFFAFRILIDNRLHAITKHFKNVAAQPENLPLSPIVVRGNDEIGVLASAFNSLATRIQGVQASLEKRVHERTANLEAEIAERRRAEEALKTSEMRLKTITD